MKSAVVYGGIGLAAVVGVGYLIARTSKEGLAELRRTPPPRLPAPGDVLPPLLGRPARLGEPFGLVPGGRYVASITVSFPLSVAASASDVAKEARDIGFADAVVTKNRVVSPPVAKGDYYVTGTFSRSPRSFPRSNAKGQVTVEDVWRIG